MKARNGQFCVKSTFFTQVLRQIQPSGRPGGLQEFTPWLNLAASVNVTNLLFSVNVVRIFVHTL